MATDPDPAEVLRSTDEKANFQRVARLLVSGGTRLLRDVFDKYCPPSDLRKRLNDPSTKKKLSPNLTKPQRDVLYPSPGVYGKSTDFDITLLFRLLSTPTICSLTPPATGDNSLTADLLRIKNYRNSLYAHVNETMDITDNQFKSFWKQISESLIRIAGQLSSKKKTEWQGAIDNFLKRPLTAEGERIVKELMDWYLQDKQVKESLEDVKSIAQETADRTKNLERVVREEGQATRQMLEEKFSSAASAAESQSAVAHLSLWIDCLSITGPGPVGGATGMVVGSQESQEVVQGAEVTSHQPLVKASNGSGGEIAQNGGLPSTQQVLNLIATTYIQKVNPSNPEEFNGFVQYLEKVRKLLVVNCEKGSLIITVECGSLQILNELWEDYLSGHLDEMAQKFLVTEDILKAFNLSEMKLTTAIVKEDYLACRDYFLERGSGLSVMDVDEEHRFTVAQEQNLPGMGARDINKDFEPPQKRRKLVVTGDQSNSDDVAAGAVHDVLQSAYKPKETDSTGEQSSSVDGEVKTDVVFALDFSSTVKKEELQKEFNFVKDIAKCWKSPPESFIKALVVYGDNAETIPWDPDNDKIAVQQTQSKCRRMDLALREAANKLHASRSKNKLVVLITTGKQVSGAESKEDDQALLVSASEELTNDIKVVIVPVGFETDFKELGLIVKRPQSLYPLSGFKDMDGGLEGMPCASAKNIASNIKETLDIETYAKKAVYTTLEFPKEAELWENISVCSDVLEGAWYLFYDNKKKPSRSETVKKFIQESIDSFHTTLITESQISISLVVCGPPGAGKSFFLNFLLNWDLPPQQQVENGPLPSADDENQTLLPIYIKYSKHVKVSHKQNGGSPEVWFHERDLFDTTLKRVNELLKMKFKKGEKGSVELCGPFKVFDYLKEKTRAITRSGHLELEVDVELVDLPGYDDKVYDEVSRADILLFFDSGQVANRPVSSEDIRQVFRRHRGFEFISRPKFVHVANNRRKPSSVSTGNFENELQKKKNDLEKAWSVFLPGSSEDKDRSDDRMKTGQDEDRMKKGLFEDVRKKLPYLYEESLLKKLSTESEVVYFHSENPDLIDSLKNVISDHVESVKIKQIVHPFLKGVHHAAKKLKQRISQSLSSAKKGSTPVRKVSEKKKVIFEMGYDINKANDLVESFLDHANLQLQLDFNKLFHFLYNNFLYSSETLEFLFNSLKASLKTFTAKLIFAFRNDSDLTLQEAHGDLIDVITTLCDRRVKDYCTYSAHAYLRHVLDEGKDKNPLLRREKKEWSTATSDSKKKFLCGEFLDILLDRTFVSLGKRTRGKKFKKSCSQLAEQLEQAAKELYAAKVLGDDASKAKPLVLLHGKLQAVIKFCNKSIREINPHPSLDVQNFFTLPMPEEIKDKDEISNVPSQPTYEKIVTEVSQLLQKSGTRGAGVIRKLQTKLRITDLELRDSQSVDQLTWAKALTIVLMDENHFDMKPDPSLVLDDKDEDVQKLLSLARKRLFAYEKSSVTCKIVVQPLSENENEIRLRMNKMEMCIEVLVSSRISKKLDDIRKEFQDPSEEIAPIFIPSVRPGPTPDILGNYFLEEDPWSKDALMGDGVEDEGDGEDVQVKESKTKNIFLVVEERHLEIFKTTISGLSCPNNVNLMYIVLPQNGRGIGVTRAIIKSLAERFDFPLYWTIDDNVQFMHHFDGNERTWYKCALTRGLLFGQRVFQACLSKPVKKLDDEQMFQLFTDVTSSWPSFAERLKAKVCSLLMKESCAALQKNPLLLHRPFKDFSGQINKDLEEELKCLERRCVDECRKRLFEGTDNHIAGVSLSHMSANRYDYMSKYPAADYMRSEQRYKVVLHNARALKGRNYVTDEMIFLDEDNQVLDKSKRNSPYWGIEGSDKSFCHALTVSGVIGYQVIRIVHSHKKLTDVSKRIGPSYPASQSPHRSEDEDEGDCHS